jgi:DNA-binding MarR family transcriptional regulator
MMGFPGLDDNEQRCWQLFLDSSMRMLATVNGSPMATHRLTLLDVLLPDLRAHSDPGAVRMIALADALMLRPGRVGKRIRSLEKRELVSRRPTRYDRRGVLVSITHTGRAELDRARRQPPPNQHSTGSSPSGWGGLARGAVGPASPGRGTGVWAFAML